MGGNKQLQGKAGNKKEEILMVYTSHESKFKEIEIKLNKLRKEADDDIIFAEQKKVLFNEKVKKMFDEVYDRLADDQVKQLEEINRRETKHVEETNQ